MAHDGEQVTIVHESVQSQPIVLYGMKLYMQRLVLDGYACSLTHMMVRFLKYPPRPNKGTKEGRHRSNIMYLYKREKEKREGEEELGMRSRLGAIPYSSLRSNTQAKTQGGKGQPDLRSRLRAKNLTALTLLLDPLDRRPLTRRSRRTHGFTTR